MTRNIDDILSQRTDLSQFVVHLTKSTENEEARHNLISIIKDKEIRAADHHCYFSPKLRIEDLKLQKRFHVACFTETPLEKIHLLTDIARRTVNLEPYGLVFLKDKIRKMRGNPVLYVYEENYLMTDYLMTEYEYFIRIFNEDGTVGNFFTLGALVNIVKKGHDFHWEREWRVRRRLKFEWYDIYAVIAPEEDHSYIRRRIPGQQIEYIPFIDPTWNYEKVLSKMSEFVWNKYVED